MYILSFIYLFLFFELYEYNQWRLGVIFTIETTQRSICGIAVLCKIVMF